MEFNGGMNIRKDYYE